MPRCVKLLTLGCRLNEAELEDWARGFTHAGWQIVDHDHPADLIVINTCAVTADAVRKSRQLLRRQQREHPTTRLVISGCLATLDANAVARDIGVSLVVGNADKDQLVEIALASLDLPALPPLENSDADLIFARGRQRAFVKVQDGCRHQCSFCITTQARGAERSRPVATVIETINRLHQTGIQEIVLAGVHLGGYGRGARNDLATLIRHVLTDTAIPRLRLGSLEPWDLPDDFWSLFANPRLMPHLHLPLQSGSDVVLRRMARRCRRDEFVRLVEQGRARIANLNVTTDIIIGFPGETDDDWQQTLELVEAMQFGHIHAFSYSPRAGTLAAGFADQVDDATTRQRYQTLQSLARRMTTAVLRQQIGRRTTILCEGASGKMAIRCGYTPNYLPVQIVADRPQLESSQLIEVILTGLTPDGAALIGIPTHQADGRRQDVA